MLNYTELLRVLENSDEGSPAFLEYYFPKPLAEQLIWRRGDNLWGNELSSNQTLIDAYKTAGVNYGVLKFNQALQDADSFHTHHSNLNNDFGIVANSKINSTQNSTKDFDMLCEDINNAYDVLLKHEKIKIIIIDDVLNNDKNEKELFSLYQNIIDKIKKYDKKSIVVDSSKKPISLNKLIELNSDGVYLNENYQENMPHIIRNFSNDVAILGDTKTSTIMKSKPKDIIDYISSLQKISKNKGYAYGTGNLGLDSFPYLNFVAVLTAFSNLY